jgi:2-dehydropantoate 2-reductase
MLNIDAQARSSMWEDLQAGRPTEIDVLNGAVLEPARSLGRDAPLNRRICALIHQGEGRPAPALSGTDLMTALNRDA